MSISNLLVENGYHVKCNNLTVAGTLNTNAMIAPSVQLTGGTFYPSGFSSAINLSTGSSLIQSDNPDPNYTPAVGFNTNNTTVSQIFMWAGTKSGNQHQTDWTDATLSLAENDTIIAGVPFIASDPTDATPAGTGSIQCAGGVKVDKKVYANELETVNDIIVGGDAIIRGFIAPNTDNVVSVGTASKRWTTVYASNGVINTSDANKKKDIEDLDSGLDFINQLKPKKYRMKEGDDKLHFGLLAQDIEKLVGVHNMVDNTDGHYGLRYHQLVAPLIKSIQELKQEIDDLKNPTV